MRSRNQRCVLMPVLLAPIVVFGSIAYAHSQVSPLESPGKLQNMLRETQRYCEKVKNIALHYICKERITDKENILRRRRGGASGLLREKKYFDVLRVKRSTYVYDYQLLRKNDELKEQRILLEENRKKRNKKDVELSENLKYSSQYLVYGPVGFLSAYWQNYFDYEIVGTETIRGEPTVLINAVPNQERDENYNFGRIWINQKNQIVRLEWEPVSIKNYQDESLRMQRGRIGPNYRPGTIDFEKKVVWTVEYEVEKNGVRFPSRQIIREKYVFQSATQGREYETVKQEIVFDYIDYKFFVVDTEIKY
jgi:hypothetical protein